MDQGCGNEHHKHSSVTQCALSLARSIADFLNNPRVPPRIASATGSARGLISKACSRLGPPITEGVPELLRPKRACQAGPPPSASKAACPALPPPPASRAVCAPPSSQPRAVCAPPSPQPRAVCAPPSPQPRAACAPPSPQPRTVCAPPSPPPLAPRTACAPASPPPLSGSASCSGSGYASGSGYGSGSGSGSACIPPPCPRPRTSTMTQCPRLPRITDFPQNTPCAGHMDYPEEDCDARNDFEALAGEKECSMPDYGTQAVLPVFSVTDRENRYCPPPYYNEYARWRPEPYEPVPAKLKRLGDRCFERNTAHMMSELPPLSCPPNDNSTSVEDEEEEDDEEYNEFARGLCDYENNDRSNC